MKLPSRLTALAGALTLVAAFGVSLLQDLIKDFLPEWAIYVVIAAGLVAYAVGWQLRRRSEPPDRVDRRRVASAPPRIDLVGREVEVRAGARRLTRSRFLLVHGPRNIGTSEVALEVARRVVPDEAAQVYVDLRAREADSSEGVERVKIRVLTALGLVTPLARSDEEAADQVRSALAARQRVLVLDNARTAEQVDWLPRPIPPGSYVVVAGDVPPRPGTDDLPVGPLSPEHGLEMLRRGPLADRVPPDGPEVARLAAGYLKSPAVVERIRRWLEQHPAAGVATLLVELSGGAPPAEEQTEVLRGVLALLTAGLSADARRLLALLPHVRLTFPTVGAGAALLDRPAPRAERALDELARATLIDAIGGGRYRIPREVRTLGPPGTPRRLPAALGRLVAHYAEAAAEPAAVLGERWPLPLGGDDEAVGGAAAEAWFQGEDLDLLALLRSAARERLPLRSAPRLREIADALDVWFRRDRRPQEREAAAEAALAAAVRLRDPVGQQTAQLRLAAVARSQGRLEEAADRLGRLRPGVRGAAAEARWATGWGVQQLATGDAGGARSTFEGNLRRRPRRDAVGRVTDRIDLGAALLAQGELDSADGRLRDAAGIAAGAGDPVGLACAQELLGVVAARRGRTEDALGVWSDAFQLYELVHDEPGQARCLLHTGTVLADRDPEQARRLLSRSLDLRESPTGVGVALAHLLLAELAVPGEAAVPGVPAAAEDHRAQARAALTPWEGRLDPPDDVAVVRRRLDHSK